MPIANELMNSIAYINAGRPTFNGRSINKCVDDNYIDCGYFYKNLLLTIFIASLVCICLKLYIKDINLEELILYLNALSHSIQDVDKNQDILSVKPFIACMNYEKKLSILKPSCQDSVSTQQYKHFDVDSLVRFMPATTDCICQLSVVNTTSLEVGTFVKIESSPQLNSNILVPQENEQLNIIVKRKSRAQLNKQVAATKRKHRSGTKYYLGRSNTSCSVPGCQLNHREAMLRDLECFDQLYTYVDNAAYVIEDLYSFKCMHTNKLCLPVHVTVLLYDSMILTTQVFGLASYYNAKALAFYNTRYCHIVHGTRELMLKGSIQASFIARTNCQNLLSNLKLLKSLHDNAVINLNALYDKKDKTTWIDCPALHWWNHRIQISALDFLVRAVIFIMRNK